MAVTSLPNLPDLDLLFYRLDKKAVPTRWRPQLALALIRLGTLQAMDVAILSYLASILRAHGPDLHVWANEVQVIESPAPGAQDEHPIATTLLMSVATRDQASSGVQLLAAITVELVLRAKPLEEGRIETLASSLRGTFAGKTSGLRILLGGAQTLPELQAQVSAHVANQRPLHQTFENLWKSWLRARLSDIILSDPESLRLALNLPLMAADISAPEPTFLVSDGDPDDSAEISQRSTEPFDPGETQRSAGADVERAKASTLVRASQGDLLAPPDQFIPLELLQRLTTVAIRRTEVHCAKGEYLESVPYAALALLIAGGFREIDLRDVRWGNQASDQPVIHETEPLLIRPLIRAPHAVQPGQDLQPWLEPCLDHVQWPLPPPLHRLLLVLADAPMSRTDNRVLPLDRLPGGKLPDLFYLIDTLLPGSRVGTLHIRQALGAHIARNLGSDVAQLVLSDTFSMTAAPTYYCASSQSALVSVVNAAHLAWFGSSAFLPHLPNGSFGSRLVLSHEAAQHWAQALRSRRRSVAHRGGDTLYDEWTAHRDFLVSSLCAVTGHRPLDAIGAIDLDQIIPEYALIILRDKQIDPLRKVRIAATGARWINELRDFLDRLIEIANQTGNPEAASLATAILRSEEPLFSTPTKEGPRPFAAADLRETMPEVLRATPNHYRHRLNQELQRRGIDPELRFAQMGWVVSPAHATADLSPRSARDLALELGPVLDAILLHDGWFNASQRLSPWSWHGVPLRPMRDWASVAEAHRAEHRQDIGRIRQDLRERGNDMAGAILVRLAKAFAEFIPSLRLNVKKRVLERVYDKKEPILICDDHWRLLCDRVRQMDDRPHEALEAAVTRIILHRLLKRSHCDGITTGALPRRPSFSATTQPSPFFPGLGLAIRHAQLLREMLLEHVPEKRSHDQEPLALLSVLLYSPYRKIEWATAAINAAAHAARARAPGDCVRIPATVNLKPFPMVLNGIAAIIVVKCGRDAPTTRASSPEVLSRWLLQRLPAALFSDGAIPLDNVVHTACAAGVLELSGPERLLLTHDNVTLTSVSVERCFAADDAWPLRTAKFARASPDEIPGSMLERDSAKKAACDPVEAKDLYHKLTKLLNPKTLHNEPKRKGDGHRGWRGSVARGLEQLLKQTGERTTIGFVVGFALHRLHYGGAIKSELQQGTIHTDVTRFAEPLLRVVARRDMTSMDPETLLSVYVAILEGKPPSARPLVLGAIRMFHRYLEIAHQFHEISFGEIAALVGSRQAKADAGLLTAREVEGVYEVLQQELVEERMRSDASPDFIRLAELRIVLYVLLEASGARPASIHGLVLGDLHFLGEDRDFVHLHRTGDYGSVKTLSSVGFVPLSGRLWHRARSFVMTWLQKEQSLLSGSATWKTPLFAETTGSITRFSRDLLEMRIRILLRWATNDPQAQLYWLRKRRVMERHREAANREQSRARHIYAELCACGHADIITPLESYVSDPAIAMAHSLIEGRQTPRADILAVTGLPGAPLDMAWQRRRAASNGQRMSVVLERLPLDPVKTPAEDYAPPPRPRRRMTLAPIHIDMFARALSEGASMERAALIAGLSRSQMELLQKAAIALYFEGKLVPWKLLERSRPREVMRPPRQLHGTKGLFAAMENVPSPTLIAMANIWVARHHRSALLGPQVLLPLFTEMEVQSTRELLEELEIPAQSIRMEAHDDVWALVLDRPTDGARPPDADQLTLSSAMAWLLAMVWLHQQLIAQ